LSSCLDFRGEALCAAVGPQFRDDRGLAIVGLKTADTYLSHSPESNRRPADYKSRELSLDGHTDSQADGRIRTRRTDRNVDSLILVWKVTERYTVDAYLRIRNQQVAGSIPAGGFL
jgi:hypothetical protein